MLEYSHGWIRAVTHYGITAADIDRTIAAAATALKETQTSTSRATAASLER